MITQKSEVEKVAVKPSPDGYRGDMSCLIPAAPYTAGKEVDPTGWGHYAYEVVSPDGKVVGIIEDAYGNNGDGKLAASRFTAAV